MSIEWFRDLALSIFGLGATAGVIILAVVAWLFYRRVKPILESIETTTRTVENITSTVEEEVAKPLAKVASFVQGLQQAIGLVSRFTNKKEDD